MSVPFSDVEIVDLDLSKTTWSRVHSAMRTLYLRLSREPEVEWVRFFHEERESRIVIKRHGLWIEDGYIVFDCLLDDIETHHLPDFRLSIEYANAKYREYLAARQEAGEQVRDEARNERAELAALRERIRRGEPAPRPPGARGAGKHAASVPARRSSPAPAPSKRAPAPMPAPAASPQPAAEKLASSSPASAGNTAGRAEDSAEFNAKREEWRARFRAALASRPKEPSRGDD